MNGQTDRVLSYHLGETPAREAVIAENRKITINYSISELYLSNLKNEHGDFFTLSIPGHSKSSDPGKPELPVWNQLIEIPSGDGIHYRISDVKSETINPSKDKIRGILFPKQADLTKNQDRLRTGFIIDREIYGRKGIISNDTVSVEFLGIIRNKSLAALHVFPIRYNPYLNEIEVITSMKIEVFFDRGEIKPSSGGAKGSLLFSKSLDKGILNYNPEDVITGYTDRPVSMIILTDTIFRKHLEPYTLWKTQKGFRITTLYKGAGLAGVSFAALKDTISKIYNSATPENPAPDYLLIVGDVTKIPLSEGTTNVSDMYYGEFDGNGDYLPDLYIGRLPVADTTELKAVVKKLVGYEKFQFADTNTFYSRALITAGNDGSYSTYMNGQLKYAVTNYLNSSNKIGEHVFYYPGSASSEDTIKKLINRGVSFVNYSGHGDASGWIDPLIKVPEVALFRNKNMYPFVISNACRTGQYNIAASFGNKLIVSADKGAVGFIGCSNDSYWDEDYYWAVGLGPVKADPLYSETGLGAYDRLFHSNNEAPSDWYVTMGQVNHAGNMAVSTSTSSRKKYYWETYTLLGDPSIIPFIGTPDTFKIQLPDTLPNKITTVSLTLDPFSYVAISHFDTLWDASFASPTGAAVLNIPEMTDDSCLIVITGQNKKPLVKTVYFSDVKDEYINLKSVEINDQNENNNQLADFGETIYLKLTVSNLGLSDAGQLYAKIESSSDWLTIITDSVFIGTLASKSEIVIDNVLEIKITDLIEDNSYASLALKLKDSKSEKTYPIDINLHAPVLGILNCTIDDELSGNGNFIADPGELVTLVFKITNSGSSDISGSFRITGSTPGLTVLDPSVGTGNITHGDTIFIRTEVLLAPTLVKGTNLEITTTLDCDPYIINKSYIIPVGKIRESFEYQSFEIFPWINNHARPWIITDGQFFDGQFSARSAVISHNTESVISMKVNVPVPDTVKFMCKVSSEVNYDFLSFKLNGSQVFKISGETGWTEKKIALREGFNLLEWIYKKDQSVSAGSDCGWIDFISFPPSAFNRVDLKTGKIITPQPGKSYNQEVITAEVINLGTDTIKSFNLAYRIEEDTPVAENFTKTLIPGDTVVVAFSLNANLSGDGPFIIKVYGLNNNDSYLKNDTTSLLIVNTAITPLENPDNKVTIMPNPFSSSFRILLDANAGEDVRINIFTMTGKNIWEEEARLIPGENILTVTPDNIPPGFYTLSIRGKLTNKAARLIKTR